MNKYDLIVQDLKTDITIGTYPAYSRLPSVAQLCEHYEVSKITINKATRTFLSSKDLSSGEKAPALSSKSWKKEHKLSQVKKSPAKWKVSWLNTLPEASALNRRSIPFEVEHPSEYIAKALDITTEDFVYRIVRVRLVEGTAQVIEYTYMPISLIPNLKNDPSRALDLQLY